MKRSHNSFGPGTGSGPGAAPLNDSVVIIYNCAQVSVPKEVADFLEQDWKREQAQEKQDEAAQTMGSFMAQVM